MKPKTQVRPIPAWMLPLMLLSALAGIGTLFADGLVQVALTVFVFGSAAVYLRDRYRAANGVNR